MVFALRNLKAINEYVIPFFDKYTLLGTKSYEYKHWRNLSIIYSNKLYLSENVEVKYIYLEMIEILKQLNSKRDNTKKINRLRCMENWFKKLNGIPRIQDKLEIKNQILARNKMNIPFFAWAVCDESRTYGS